MMLVIEDEAGTRSVVPFAADVIVVGRGTEGVTFRLAERNVSRLHARFVRQNGHVFVEDLGSLIGTRVNGERISGRRRLRDGDLVQIGDYDLAVVADGSALLDAPPPLPSSVRPEPSAITAELPVPVELPVPTSAAPASGGGRLARIVVAVALVAIIAIVAAVAAGAFDVPVPPLTRP